MREMGTATLGRSRTRRQGGVAETTEDEEKKVARRKPLMTPTTRLPPHRVDFPRMYAFFGQWTPPRALERPAGLLTASVPSAALVADEPVVLVAARGKAGQGGIN